MPEVSQTKPKVFAKNIPAATVVVVFLEDVTYYDQSQFKQVTFTKGQTKEVPARLARSLYSDQVAMPVGATSIPKVKPSFAIPKDATVPGLSKAEASRLNAIENDLASMPSGADLKALQATVDQLKADVTKLLTILTATDATPAIENVETEAVPPVKTK